jgi:phosphoglycerate dehydrogenase-like enzyme
VVSTAPVPAEVIASVLPPGTRVEAADYDGLLALAPRADVVIGDWWHKVRVDGAVIARLKRCRLIQQPSAGFENIDAEAAAAAGIPVANAGPANAAPVAEHAVMGAIACLRFLPEVMRAAAEGEWDRQRFLDMDLGDLNERTVGILGLGAIGEAVATRLRAFGSRVIYNKRHRLDPSREAELGVEFRDLQALLRESQVLVLTLPLNAETRDILTAARLEMLPAGAVIVNVARGHLLDMEALARLLKSGHLRGAALDVFDEEPLPRGHGLDKLPNVLLTPHVAGATAVAKRDIFMNSIANVSRVCLGEAPLYVVNQPVAR